MQGSKSSPDLDDEGLEAAVEERLGHFGVKDHIIACHLGAEYPAKAVNQREMPTVGDGNAEPRPNDGVDRHVRIDQL